MKKRSGIHVGISSLLLIFLILCLVSFAVLSLASATADLKLSRRYALRTRSYYEACCDAEDFLAESVKNKGADAPLSKDFPISETQYLHVEISPAPDNAFNNSSADGSDNSSADSSADTSADGSADSSDAASPIISWQVITDESALALDESLPVFP